MKKFSKFLKDFFIRKNYYVIRKFIVGIVLIIVGLFLFFG